MIDPKNLRQCLGKFATGVTIVSCCDGDGEPCGITVNSFSSVSLEPPLILWNIAKVSNSLTTYLQTSRFAINILSADQQSLSSHFANTERALFDGIPYHMSTRNLPLLADTLACLECATTQIHEAGDHFIIVGEIESFSSADREPLLFYAGAYKSLT